MDSIKSGGVLIGLIVVLVAAVVASSGAAPARLAPIGGLASIEPPSPSAPVAIVPDPPSASSERLVPESQPRTPLPSVPASHSPASTGSPLTQPQTEVPVPVVAATPVAASTLVSDPPQTIGQSVQGRPLLAQRIGNGPLKVVVVGDVHGAYEANTYALVSQLLAHFREHPDEVPEQVSLWLLPSLNPDGLQTGHRWNANDVDLNRNADTDLDGCGANDWSPDTVGLEGRHPGAGGAYPFSEPESRAVRDLVEDAWIAVFYHSAADAIFVDTCQRHVPTARLAETLSQGTGYPVPEGGWTGYPVTGDLADYFAGEGVAAVTLELADHESPEFERNLAGLRTLLGGAEEIVRAEATQVQAEYRWLDRRTVGTWNYAPGSFVHPLALEVLADVAYLLDGGRVLAVELTQPAPPRLLLSPGDDVAGVPVLEPLDLALNGKSLWVLDRAGDVYRYDPSAGQWSVERYDRPAGTSSDHYYVALAASSDLAVEPPASVGYLLETTHEQVWRIPLEGSQPAKGTPWFDLPQSRDVDLDAVGDDVYALVRAMDTPMGQLLRFRDGRQVTAFRLNVGLMHPRQVRATQGALYVLDRAGRRLLALDPDSGALQTLFQFPDRRAISALWADPAGERLLLAGRDALYFYGEPDRLAQIEAGPVLAGPQPHDLTQLERLRGFQMPIEGATVASRDFQMPGAPRHYRLGVHEGIDFYSHTVGVPVGRTTPVRAAAAGVVVRALVDYRPLTAAQAGAWVERSRSLGYTPPDVLDGYRGRQVWIDHGGGLVSRYAHLGSLGPGIVEGAQVVQGQVIGTVGNSGTPASVSSDLAEVHLHFELWLGDHYVGQFLRPIEVREWLEKVLR